MKPTAISRNKLSRMSDRELTDLWHQTGRREYAVALLLNYLPFIYGVVSKYARDAATARTTVLEFAAVFPEMAHRCIDTFSVALYRELLSYIHETEDETYAGRREFVTGLSSGEECAVALFAEGKIRLAKPQRECVELFLVKGETFGYISENTGYLRQNVRSYIDAGLAELAPPAAAEPVADAAPFAGLHTKFIQYIKGETSGAAAHEIELRSLWDRFLADALEGYDVAGEHVRELAELDREISAGVFPVAKKNKGLLAAVGGIVVLIALGFFIFGNSPHVAVEPEVPVADPAPTVVADSLNIKGDGRASIIRISERSEGPAGEYVTVPQIGLRKYNEYLHKAVVRPADGWHGEITLSFTVNKYGRPSRIRIIEYLSQDAHREAIRLIENGPEWTPADEEVTIVLMFE